jgi:hypothetical protein
MVNAILAGRKSQTRRIVKVQPQVTTPGDAAWRDGKSDLWRNAKQYEHDCCPYGVVGDYLWVKETWRTLAMWDSLAPRAISMEPGVFPVKYDANNAINRPTPYPWGKTRPSLFMMQAFSRITLDIVSVRVERLQDISYADCVAEGCKDIQCDDLWSWEDAQAAGVEKSRYQDSQGRRVTAFGAKAEYSRLWETINGHGSWSANPWVWCVEFRRVK